MAADVRSRRGTPRRCAQDAGRVISEAIARDPGEMRFTIMALAKAQAGEED